MTEDELDLLASAYLDGEATSEEVALVERDPQLLARVESLRGVAERLSVPVAAPQALKEQQLAAALSAFEFEDESEVESEVESNVIDLTKRSSRSIPSWLPAAAALLLLGGGGAWVIGQASGSDDTDAASSVFAEDEATEAGAGEDSAGLTAQGAESAPVEAETSTEAAAENRAAGDDSADDAMADFAEEEAAEESDSDSTADEAQAAPANDGEQEGGFFPREPVLTFTSIPSLDDLPEELSQELRDELSTSLCGESLTLADGQSISGYLPIEVAGQLAELFVIVDEAGEQTIAVVNNDGCQLNQ